MRIGDFEFTRDSYGWTMKHYYMGKSKETGEPKEQCRETYYPTFEKALKVAIDRSLGECDDMREIKTTLDSFKEKLCTLTK